MKKRVWLLGLMILLCVVPSFAQDQQESTTQENPPATDQEPPPKPKRVPIPTPKAELSAGYTLHRYDVSSGPKLSMNGWYGSGEYNVFRHWLGVAAELSGAYKDEGVNGDTSLYTLMVGPQIYPFRHHKVTPFVHVLFGEGYVRISFPAYAGFPAFTRSDTSRAWQGGGGLDLDRWEHWGVRLIQIDYGSTNFFSTPSYTGQTNIRASVGLTYRWGEKK